MIRAAMLGLLGLAGLGLVGACSGEDTEGGACAVDADCEGGNECTSYKCKEGTCTKQVALEGKPVYADYVAGDCKRSQCGPGGTIVQAVDTNDVSIDLDPCTVNTCSGAGVPGSATAADGVQCGATPTVKCVGGACTGCATNADCVAQSVCHKATCNAATMVCEYVIDAGKVLSNIDEDKVDCISVECDATGDVKIVALDDGTACGSSSTCSPMACKAGACVVDQPPPQGTPSSTDMAGDCRSETCDGMGGTESVVDDMDAPPDDNKADCVKPACMVGEQVQVADVGNPCTNTGGIATMCDASGNCPL